MLAMKPKVFNCSTCKKTFPTFQALAGHRFSHSKSKNTESKVQFEETHAAAGAIQSMGLLEQASQSGRKVLEFNLNEPCITDV